MCLTHGDTQGADPRARQPQTSALPDQSLSMRAALPVSLPQGHCHQCSAERGLTGTLQRGGGISGLSASLTCHLWSQHPQAFSGFYHTLHFLNLTGGQSLSSVNATIGQICASRWEQVRFCPGVHFTWALRAHPQPILCCGQLERARRSTKVSGPGEGWESSLQPPGPPCSASLCSQVQ